MIALIARAKHFSPNSQERDAAILQAVAQCLQQAGHRTLIVSEEHLPHSSSSFRAVLSMARSASALHRLSEWHSQGLPVLNSPSALLRNTRSHLDALCVQAGAVLPTLANTTDLALIETHIGYPLWLKRGDTAAQSPKDVQHVTSRQELQAALPHFSAFSDFTLTAHAEGNLLKFYGVEGTSFFHAAPPSYSKFGLEAHNTSNKEIPIVLPRLKVLANHVAQASGLTIYGGDAVVRPNGSIALIDFNDWPSFSSCLPAAAQAIVECISPFL